MSIKAILAGTAALFVATAAFAQTAPAPTTQGQQRPAATTAPVTAPIAAPTAATQRPAAPQAQAQTVNVNTATTGELDKLPQIGEARAKAIVEARTKGGRFKDWNDFVARAALPKNAEEALKGKISF